MSDNIILDSLNKGVPIASVDIRYRDFIEISDDKDAVGQVIKNKFQKYMDFLGSFGQLSDLEFFMTMMAHIDGQTLERRLVFSPNGFLSSLVYNLNYKNVCKSNNLDPKFDNIYCVMERLREPFKQRLDILHKVGKPDELRREFPLLYRKYQERMELQQQANQLLLQLSRMGRAQKREFIRKYDGAQRKTIPDFNLQKFIQENRTFDFASFRDQYVETLACLIEHSDEIIDYLLTSPIDFSQLGHMDKRKLELFLASQFLSTAETVSAEHKQDYLYYVCSYFGENKNVIDSDLSITIGKNSGIWVGFLPFKDRDGYVLTAREVYERYCQILVANPNLRAIDFSHLDFSGLSLGEVMEFMTAYLSDLSAQWDFLAPGDRSYEEEVVKKIRSVGSGLTDEERSMRQGKALERFMEKKELYDSSDPLFRVRGKGTFDGYIGHIYSNGRVVLDTFYDDADSGKISDGQAVYAMGIQEFYELSQLSKTEIIRKGLCNRYVHKGEWAKRVLEREIQAASTGVAPTVEVKQLIKKGAIEMPDDDN